MVLSVRYIPSHTMKSIITFMLLLSSVIAGAAVSDLRIQGKIQDLANDTVEIQIIDIATSGMTYSTVCRAENGAFNVAIPVERVSYLAMSYKVLSEGKTEKRDISFIAVPDEEIKIENCGDATSVSGTAFYTEYNVFEAFNRKYQERWRLMNKAFQSAKGDDSADMEKLKKEYSAKADAMRKGISDEAMKYISQNPLSEVSVVMLNNVYCTDIDKAVVRLSEKVRQGRFKEYCGIIVEKAHKDVLRREAKEKIREGNEAPDFTLTDIHGKQQSLSMLRGKYVVLDFWGSWCGWCLKGMPEMKKYYERYSGKLEILGIACNDKEAKWKAAVEKHSLPWLHVLNATPTDVSALYNITGFPTKIVLNPEGRILKIVSGESPEFYTYLDSLFNK